MSKTHLKQNISKLNFWFYHSPTHSSHSSLPHHSKKQPHPSTSSIQSPWSHPHSSLYSYPYQAIRKSYPYQAIRSSTFTVSPEPNILAPLRIEGTIISSLDNSENRPALLKICNSYLALGVKLKLLNLSPAYLSSCISHHVLDSPHIDHTNHPSFLSQHPISGYRALAYYICSVWPFFSSLM